MSEELEILHLAQRCHTSWCEAKREAGYTYGPVTDDSAKTNANLVPWSFLPEEIKESNINTARETYNLVSKSGFKFVHAASIIPAFKEYAAKMIAKELHLAWARDKIAAGWTYSPITDKAAKKHRDLCVIAGVCSYEEFCDTYPDDAKFDIDTAKGILNGDDISCPIPDSVAAMLGLVAA